MSTFAAVALAALLFAPTLGSAQDLYWETQTTGAGSKTQTAKVYASAKAMKIVGDGDHAMILRADQEKMIALDTKAKTYWETSFSELETRVKSMESQMQAAMKQMEDKLKDLSPEQRAAVEKMMPKPKGEKESPVSVKATNDTKTIGGHPCTKYIATQDGKTVLVAWATPDIEAFAPVRKNWLAMQKRLAETSRSFGGGVADAYNSIDGFPMETEMGNVRTVVTKVEERTLPATEFDIPAGYTKTQPPGGPPGPGQ